ncbi:MAG TPA: NAD(P)/FAD-dependent oxidoreductase, partial [Pyrinomonadaceae bacterium]|nr:NAD(P)/FAD-dependent oxidoreductase [Pyrinomonadaceae bacterium]
SQLPPHRLAQFDAERRGANKPLDQLSNNELQQVSEELNHWQVQFTATEGYDRAEVTLGGVSTAELSSKTMESKLSPGLYFIGEVVDVTGWLGGYNFQWAWSSGHAAASAL